MGLTSFLSRSFLFGLSNTEVIGFESFKRIIDSRKDVAARERGLLTGIVFSKFGKVISY